MTNNRLTYLGGRGTGLRPDTCRLALGLTEDDCNNWEEEFLAMPKKDRDTYSTFMENPVLDNDKELRDALAKRFSLALQVAMVRGHMTTQELEKTRFMMGAKETYVGLTDWIVRITEKRPVLSAHINKTEWWGIE